jgi:CxxC motif-containing protein (DUF1111 family)
MNRNTAWILALTMLLAACQDEAIELSAPRAGGDTTIDDQTTNAFSNPAPNLSPEALEQHLAGDVAFEATFVTAPAIVNPGLGPVFNNRSCAACHIKDGRGLPVFAAGAQGSMALVRVSTASGPVPGLGTQLQDHAVYGTSPEASVELEWIEEPGTYPSDGAPYWLRRPKFSVALADGSPLPAEVMTSLRIPPPVFGLGLLEAVPEATLLALADPEDADGDGISGRVNHVWDEVLEAFVPGRFGWKSNTPNLRQQAAAAYVNDIGVTNPIFFDDGAAPEIDAVTLDDVTFYTQTLAVPARRDVGDAHVERGDRLFAEIGCASCHVPSLQTGEHPIAAVRQQRIHPYTDLLLHNMGFDLADGRPDFEASGTEWRTPPLWGIGLSERVLSGAGFLHDGRARSLEEAILWHGGESQPARDAFHTMSASDRAALIDFVGSL